MCKTCLPIVIIASLLCLQASPSSLALTDEVQEHEQQQRTLDYQEATVSKYFYPVTVIGDGTAYKQINLVSTTGPISYKQVPAKRVAETKRCIPLLSQNQTHSAANYPSIADLAANISFPVRNINMRVAPASGSINSALRLLSTFDSHLGNDDSGAGEDAGDDDDGSGDDDEASTDSLGADDSVVRFRQNRLRLQGLNLSMLNIHIYKDSEPKFALGITIKNTTLTGRFVYDGPALLSDSKLAGYYRMSIDNVYLMASSNLTKKVVTTGQEEQFDLATNEFRLNITNLGYITIDIFDTKNSTVPTTSYLLRMLQRLLQRTIKRTYYTFETYIRETLESQSRKFIDCELTRFSPMLHSTTNTTSNSNDGKQSQPNSQFSQSDLARIINGEIERSRLDSVSLPTFDYQQSIFGTSASIHFDNGTMSGLDHLNLNGETRVKLQDGHLIVNASIGWQNLRPYYNWRLYIGSPQTNLTSKSNSTKQQLTTAPGKIPISKGFVAFTIKAVSYMMHRYESAIILILLLTIRN